MREDDTTISNEEINEIAEWFETLTIKEIKTLKAHYDRCLIIQKQLGISEGLYVH